MYNYFDLTAMVLNCHLPTTRHINYIGLSWHSFLITLLHLQLMVCFTHISCNNRNSETTETAVFCEKNDRNRTGNGIVEP